MKKVKIALLGLGNVGKGVLSIIRENKEQIVKRSGYEVEIAKILVRDKDKDRGVEIPSEILTTNYDDILNDDDIKIVAIFRNDGNKLLIAGRFARYVVHKAHVALRR